MQRSSTAPLVDSGRCPSPDEPAWDGRAGEFRKKLAEVKNPVDVEQRGKTLLEGLLPDPSLGLLRRDERALGRLL